MTVLTTTPRLDMGNIDGRLRELLAGRRSRAEAFLVTIDALVEDLDDPRDDEIEDIECALEQCLSLDRHASRRILESDLAELVAMDVANAWMPVPVVRRLLTMGINPLGVVLMGEMEIGGATVQDGPHLGTVVECETSRRQAGRHEISPSFVSGMLVWDGHANDVTLLDAGLPETAICQMEGRRLEEVASSMLTDGMGLVIGEVARSEADLTTMLLEKPRMIQLRDVPALMLSPPDDWTAIGRRME